MSCPTCKNKILEPYELNGIEYCSPNCAYNEDGKDFWGTSFFEQFKKHNNEENRVLNRIIEDKRLSRKIIFKI